MTNRNPWTDLADSLRMAAEEIMQKPIPEVWADSRAAHTLVGQVAHALLEYLTTGISVPYTRDLPDQVAILDGAIGKIAVGQVHLLDDTEHGLLELEPDPEDPQNKVRLKNDALGEAARYYIQYRNIQEIDFVTNAHDDAFEMGFADDLDKDSFERADEIARAVIPLAEDIRNLAQQFSRVRGFSR